MVLTIRPLRAALMLAAFGGLTPRLAAQGCASGHVVADLGINGIDCLACTIYPANRAFPDGRIAFGAEPTLRAIRPGGPADGRIRDGDVLVAVDGMPITTDAGARRFWAPAIGTPLQITVRRNGQDVSVTVVPTQTCASGETPDGGEALGPTPPARADRGWLGIGISCSWCSSQELPDGTLDWSFRESPQIIAVDSMGPARNSGLRPGDVIQAIDGVALTTPEGGRRFGAVRPGDKVRLTYARNGASHVVVVTASRRAVHR